MATERQSRPMGGFFKFLEIGDSVTGIVKEAKTGVNGPFLIIDRPLVRRGRKGPLEKYATLAMGVSTDLATRIELPGDVGQIMSFTFNEKEPTTKGSPKKIFRVLQLSIEEYNKANNQADKTHASEPYAAAAKSDATGGDDELADDDGEELPF